MPPIYTLPFNNLFVLRGDTINGGAKMPALLRYLPNLNHTHFAYVGSVYGSGAWAVAEACAALGFQCTLFIAQSNDTPPWLPYIEKAGVNLIWCTPQPVATLHDMVTTTRPDLYNLPLGFDTSDFIHDMAYVVRSSIPTTPPEIWVASLSGVLARSASLAFPDATIHAVSAARRPGDVGGATIHYAPEKFHKPANTPPPYPACPFSCAKIWQFAEKQAVSGAFILNVGY
jgi:hypothetical protein